MANDREQAAARVHQAAVRIVEASPLLSGDAIVTANRIEFLHTGSTITAISSDYASAAGANPSISVFDELWAYTSERSHRLWDEMVPPPTRQRAWRLTVTYAGFEGESTLLEGLYKRGIAGEQLAPDLYAAGGLLMYWTHDFSAPWQTEQWREQMREQLRPNAYLRQIENRFVSSESTFVDMEWWDACVEPELSPQFADPRLPVHLGVDASTKRDSTAVVATTYDRKLKKVRLVYHRVFQPSPEDPLDFESTVEALLIGLSWRFRIQEVRFDPYQMIASAQRLTSQHIRMVEFPQNQGNLTEASTNLYELIKGRNLIVYPDEAMRLAIQRSVAVEMPRGWKISKDKGTHKIDVVVALGMSALSAIGAAGRPAPIIVGRHAMEWASGVNHARQPRWNAALRWASGAQAEAAPARDGRTGEIVGSDGWPISGRY